MPATRRARAAAAEREAKRRAAHEVSVERTRLVGKLDVGVLSVIAGFGGKRELWGVALAFKEHGVEILASEPTLDAILLASRGGRVCHRLVIPPRHHRRPTPRLLKIYLKIYNTRPRARTAGRNR